MQRSSANPRIFGELFASASNAPDKGQAQYYTPLKWARLFALPLPGHRPAILDLSCGNGTLLKATANDSTESRLGCDIDPDAAGLAADVTLFYPLLREVGFAADLFTLNPPWDLHWHRERLDGLAKSDLRTVRNAFAAHDGRTRRGSIDSTVATLCLALDLSSDMGEGYLLANTSTAHRLILDQGAPHEALRDHVWAVIELPEKTAAPVPSCLMFFAKDHLSGPQTVVSFKDLEAAECGFQQLSRERINLREGCEVRRFLFTDDTAALWQAAGEEWKRLAGQNTDPQFNLWLDHRGHIGAYVSLFDSRAGKVDKDEAALLHSLAGKRPLQLVVQRAQRDALKRAVAETSPWRVDPDLQRAVTEAIGQYNAARAPLYPLPAIQRLGYLDEEDFIECDKTLGHQFISGKRYAITTQTLAVRRKSKRVSLAGESEDLELTGQELAIFITGESGDRLCFMEQRLLHDDVRIQKPDTTQKTGPRTGEPLKKSSLPDDGFASSADVIHFTLQQLVDVFIVPEVPDVAVVNPEGYQRNLELLQQIESLCL